MKLTQAEQDRVIHALATYAHDSSWSGWMRWLFSKGAWHDDGAFTIDASWAQRWKRQMETPYSELPASEKESDIVEAHTILVWIEKALNENQP